MSKTQRFPKVSDLDIAEPAKPERFISRETMLAKMVRRADLHSLLGMTAFIEMINDEYDVQVIFAISQRYIPDKVCTIAHVSWRNWDDKLKELVDQEIILIG